MMPETLPEGFPVLRDQDASSRLQERQLAGLAHLEQIAAEQAAGRLATTFHTPAFAPAGPSSRITVLIPAHNECFRT
jgi:hypothetical protein